MQVSNTNNVKVYSITSASKSAIPEWMAQKNKEKLKHDEAWRNRIELIQDFQFPEASTKIRTTNDGKYIMATGVYKPQIRVFELDQLAMKFERHTSCENVTFELLSNDWQKSVHLQADRTVEFHTHYGMHYQTRVPKFGRDLTYHHPTCDTLIVGASHEVWRLNLEHGRFMTPLNTDLPEINVCKISPAHQLFGFGGSDCKVEFWHPNHRKRIGVLDIGEALTKSVDSTLFEVAPEVSAIEFGMDGLSCLIGTTTGQVLMYDLRRPQAVIVKDHQYGFPIHSLSFHPSGKILSSDTKIVKIWDKNSGSVFTNIEPPHDINDTCIFGDSGLVMMAVEGVQMQSYYIPSLGPAPNWCTFLDNLTEELEENSNTPMYDDYKFVTKKELQQLSLDHLIGTNVLKAYMHGFFVDLRLYEKAKAISNPFEFEQHKKNVIQKKIEEKRASRISTKKLPKVNKQLAQELMDQDAKKKKKGGDILNDDRFQSMFSDPAFEVDTTSKEYQLHHPSESNTKKALTTKFEEIQEEEDDDISQVSSEAESEKEPEEKPKKKAGPKFFKLKDGFQGTESLDKALYKGEAQELPFEHRLEHQKDEIISTNIQTGMRSITFKASNDNKPRERRSASKSKLLGK